MKSCTAPRQDAPAAPACDVTREHSTQRQDQCQSPFPPLPGQGVFQLPPRSMCHWESPVASVYLILFSIGSFYCSCPVPASPVNGNWLGGVRGGQLTSFMVPKEPHGLMDRTAQPEN